MKKKICFIINPISGIGKQKIVEQLIKETIPVKDFDIQINYTNAPHHATELSKNAAQLNFNLVVAVGGDGSVNEVSKGLIHSSTALGIIPAGSGNGLARHLGIPLDLKKAVSLLIQGKTSCIDTAQINGEHFINVAGIGFDAHIAALFSNYGKRGLWSYVKLILGEYFRYKEQTYKFVKDEKEKTEKAFLVSIANGSQFGNNAYISPNSNLSDHQLELCLLKKIPVYALPLFAFQLLTKRVTQSKFISISSFKELELISENTKMHLDGESLDCAKELKIKVVPASLMVVVP